ncbi:NAD(P)-binding protein [Saitoella complicata NRRL Y-17804]|nr:NAD(P)-binding protein [Saitoella complicata NRRL Y-17804]ODQ52173.1 NAD(P)-binding protein [Saitoella complicata NRRL Y-17804]
MPASPKVIVVTGANKGIGAAIVKKLLTQPHTPGAPTRIIYLTARDPALGHATYTSLLTLRSPHAIIKFHALDITSTESCEEFKKFLQVTHGYVDVLVNNAGVAWKGDAFDEEVVRGTLAVNFYGTIRVTTILLPLLRATGREARIVNISSGSGMLVRLRDPALRAAFRDPALTEEGLLALLKKFQTDVSADRCLEGGWPKQAYAVSKIGVTAYTKVLARRLQNVQLAGKGKGKEEDKVLVNACCPGWCRTDMAGENATQSAEEGAELPVRLAVGDVGGVTGGWWHEGVVKEW